MPPIDNTRRGFLAHIAATGLGGSLVPGVLWARLQDAGADRVTLAMVTEALKRSGIDLPEDDREALVDGANTALTRLEGQRAIAIPNDVSPPYHFSRWWQGMTVDLARWPFVVSKAPALKRRAAPDDVAQRLRMMMMEALAKATAHVDVYVVASNSVGRGPGGAPPGPGAAATPRRPRRPQGPTERPFTMANLACYPAVNVPNGFAGGGTPTSIVFYAPPYRELGLLALARAYQDRAGWHTRRPAALGT